MQPRDITITKVGCKNILHILQLATRCVCSPYVTSATADSTGRRKKGRQKVPALEGGRNPASYMRVLRETRKRRPKAKSGDRSALYTLTTYSESARAGDAEYVAKVYSALLEGRPQKNTLNYGF